MLRKFTYFGVALVVVLLVVKVGRGQNSRRKTAAHAKIWAQATSGHGSQEVLEVVRGMYQALTEERWKDFSSYFCRGATISTVDEDEVDELTRVTLYTVYEYIEASKPHIEGKQVLRREILNAEVRTYDSMAQVWTHFEAQFGPRHRRRTHGGIDALTLHHVDGQWKIVAVAYTKTD